MKRRFILFFISLVMFPLAAAQQDEPLVVLELPVEALAYHLGLKSWNFTYASFTEKHVCVHLVYYERDQTNTLVRTELTGGLLCAEGDPLGVQRITLVLGPDGTSIPVSVLINRSSFRSELSKPIDLSSFNVELNTAIGATLYPTGQSNAFILLSDYPAVNGNVVATGNPDDMDAYLALEIEYITR